MTTMSKMTGSVDDMGHFVLRMNYDTKNSEDMNEMMKTLRDSEAEAVVENYAEDHVEVVIRPGW